MRRTISLAVILLLIALPASARQRRWASAKVIGIPTEEELVGCHRYPPNKRFKLSLRGEVTIDDLVAVIGTIGCHNILVGPAVASHAAKVTLEVSDLVTAGEVYGLFRSSLEVMGLTVERTRSLWKIVDSGKAREVSTVLPGDSPVPDIDNEEFVTRLLRVRHGALNEIADVLSKLRSKEGDLTVYPPSQSLIVTDRAIAVSRMERLLPALDVEQAGARIFTLSVHGQTPSELASAIEKVVQATRRAPAAQEKTASREIALPALIPVDSARLIVIVGEPSDYRRVAALAERLDPPTADGEGTQAHVVYLEHTNAEDLVTTLREIGMSGNKQAAGRNVMSGGVALSSDVKISADKVSNAIVVFAARPEFMMVRDLITKLDVPRRQVYVEAAILDLSTDRSRQVGVGFHGGSQSGDGTTGFVAGGAPGASSIVTDAASLASLFASGGLTTGVFGKSFSIAGVTVPSFGVVLKALEQSKDVEVISQPHLLTIDNTKASLSVGQSIPFQTQALGTGTSTSGVASLLSTYARQDVALKLDITPHLNESESIRLELDGEISDVPDGQSTSQPGGPTTDKRTIKTTVVVNDGETIVLGGLQKDSQSESIEKVPGLGDIPILGRLFQYRTKQRTKQSLMIAITPYVIRGPDDLRRIFERKQREQREFMAFDAKKPPEFEPPIDYGRRRGLLEEINVTARRAEDEARLARHAGESNEQALRDGELQ